MNKGGGFPYFLWQELNEDWKTLSCVEVWALNKAAANDKRTVTLPCLNPTMKSTVNFEKMCVKLNPHGEKRLRCLILNNKPEYAAWSWKDSAGDFISFPPRVTYFLEVIFQKGLKDVDFYYKTDYEVDLSQLILKNKETGNMHDITRECIDFIHPRWNAQDMKKHVRCLIESEHLVKTVSSYNVERIKNLLFNVSLSGTEVSSSFTFSVSNQDLILALKQEAEKSNYLETAVDPAFNSEKECHVVSENGCLLSATLTHCNLEENVNKYFIIQLIKFNNKNYAIWSHYGRLGYNGLNEIAQRFSLSDAIKEFKGIFYEKTRNHWSQNFQRKQKKYDFISTYFNVGQPGEINIQALENTQTKFDKKIQDLLLLIFCSQDLKEVARKWLLKSMAVEVGLPTAKTLLHSFAALNEITSLLSRKNKGKELLQACNNYYMKMPHNFKKQSPKIIASDEDIEEEAFMLQTLSYACLTKSTSSYHVENPMDLYFQSFQCKITPLDHKSQEFEVLNTSLLELQGPTHNYKMDLLDAFKWDKESEQSRFVDKGNKMLLWHGTQLSNILGIMKNGLKLPTVEAPFTSCMFGKALYFADVSSKSANYCMPTKKCNIGLLLLCEVSMGVPMDVFHGGDYSSHPDIYGGLLAHGEYYPSSFTESILAPEACIAKGPLKRRNATAIALKYNEYIVYDERQVKILYLLKVQFS